MKVTVVGATGVLGRHVLPRLAERGYDVRAIVRREEQATWLQGLGVRTYLGDILVQESLLAPVAGSDCLLHLATAIPGDRAHGDWSTNDRIRREGTRNLLHAAARGGTHRYIQQSIIMLYGDHGHIVADELAPLKPTQHIQSAYDMEQLVQSSPLEWCILRGGHFYGPGTGAEDTWREQARSGLLCIPPDGDALVSLIHVADMAEAIVLSTHWGKGGNIYNVVDDRPVTYAELFTYVARQTRAVDPKVGGPVLPSLGCSNARIKSALAWKPAFPTYRSGLA